MYTFRYDVIPAKENSNGIKVNGTWTGLIGQLVRGVGSRYSNI